MARGGKSTKRAKKQEGPGVVVIVPPVAPPRNKKKKERKNKKRKIEEVPRRPAPPSVKTMSGGLHSNPGATVNTKSIYSVLYDGETSIRAAYEQPFCKETIILWNIQPSTPLTLDF